MRFAYHHSMCPVEQYLPLTQAAERVGFDAVTFPDSICYPREGDPDYPYNEDGSREFLDGVPFIDAFVLVAFLAGQTQKIGFSTSVTKLAVRQPVIVAKQLTSLAAMIGDRFKFGVGISPWKEDFIVSQIPWEKRGKRMDEMLEIVRGLMRGEYFGYKGEIFDIPEIKMTPAPARPVPLLVGGHAEPALKRAARLGDGWIAAGGELAELKKMINRINELRKEYQRDHLPFDIQVMSSEAYTADGIKRLRDIGVDEVLVAFRDVYKSEPDTKTVEEKIAGLEWFANEVIAKSR
ncbi:MAG TPA: TIGR03619 family F420-dependent LLM class oxidoreductase [Spongiibacteraceae bacterium]|nr:TIGR03619 family F420-dependent LLM class oxidoreductase [Spongiibacteraceae bacterium]